MSGLVVATRGSSLALWQAERVAARLREVHPGLEVRLREVRTEGDRVRDRGIETLSRTGVFTREVDRLVTAGGADVAVHSLKDEVTALPEGVVLGMVLARGPVEDVLVARDGRSLGELPPGAVVATGSLRRQAQLLRLRPDLEVAPIRGNVDTRLRKLGRGAADALILARAGLVRLGLGDRITEVLPVEDFLPAVSQGIVGVTCRAAAPRVRDLLAAADHGPTHAAARAERAWLRTLRGGCNVPAAAHAVVERDGRLLLRGRVLSPDGTRMLEGQRTGPATEAAALGKDLARELAARGADVLIREAGR